LHGGFGQNVGEVFDMEKEKKKEERHMASLELEKRRLALEGKR